MMISSTSDQGEQGTVATSQGLGLAGPAAPTPKKQTKQSMPAASLMELINEHGDFHPHSSYRYTMELIAWPCA